MKLLLLMEKFIALIGSVKGGKVSVKLYNCGHIACSKNRGNFLIYRFDDLPFYTQCDL